MFGQYKHTIDSKGRLIVPSKLREELGECFYVTVAPDTCLTIFTKPEWEKVIERSNQISLTHSGGLRMLIGRHGNANRTSRADSFSLSICGTLRGSVRM